MILRNLKNIESKMVNMLAKKIAPKQRLDKEID